MLNVMRLTGSGSRGLVALDSINESSELEVQDLDLHICLD